MTTVTIEWQEMIKKERAYNIKIGGWTSLERVIGGISVGVVGMIQELWIISSVKYSNVNIWFHIVFFPPIIWWSDCT